jgi:hypothetical protein
MKTTTKLNTSLALALLAAGCGAEETATPASVQTGALTSAPVLGAAQLSPIAQSNLAQRPVVVATVHTYACLAEQSDVTTYSGLSANGTDILSRAASENDAITGVRIAEQSDDPCWMQVDYKDVETGAVGATRTYDRCDGANPGDLEVRSLPDGAFVTGVRICLNSDGDKLKGIELIGNYAACLQGAAHVYLEVADCSEVFHAGGMDYRVCDTEQNGLTEVDCTPDGLSTYIERTNCDGENEGPDEDWESEVHCPAGMVATGFHLNTTSGGGARRMYNGVALECDDLLAD